ncbi:MAG: PD-(D/E)XK nuclease family protein [Candidatus Omnitrophica bacterium]|nr:PD-(D/E)XK nuclease family protein [Candidatus Omnitrophota bacterium]
MSEGIFTQQCVSYPFGENFIDRLAEDMVAARISQDNDFSRIACVFGGKRPALFLRRALARKIKKPFYPPAIFSMDEFIDYLAADTLGSPIQSLDTAYAIYRLAGKCAPQILARREKFSQFLPWAEEIAAFIEQLDLESIDNEALKEIEKSARIGYDVPESINLLLTHMQKIREGYHRMCKEQKVSARGWKYLNAAKIIRDKTITDFDTVVFANLYYLHKSETVLIRELLHRNQALCVFQGDQNRWSVLKNNAKNLGVTIIPRGTEEKEEPCYRFRAAFDVQSQVCAAREIVKQELTEKEDTVIVAPHPQTVVPLLCEITPYLDELNVSIGYPLRRSAIFVLFESLRTIQETRKNDTFYTKDYLVFMRHPLVKNMRIIDEEAVTRVIVHKLEEFLTGIQKSSISGSLFVSLDAIESAKEIVSSAVATLAGMGHQTDEKQCQNVLARLHAVFFRQWDDVDDFASFSAVMDTILDGLVEKSKIDRFPLALKGIEKIFQINEELRTVSFCKEKFTLEEMWGIYRQKLEGARIAFHGSPLKGAQVLGLFETRSLNFKNVIFLDTNESVLPKLTIYEPLIPREIMLNLGLNRLEKEEEIQHYQFRRLTAGARNVYLIYQENREKERSRFIEEIIWEKQKTSHTLKVEGIDNVAFALKVSSSQKHIDKTEEMAEYLRGEEYSASRLNTYLNCPLQFYYRYVLGFKEREELLEDPEAHTIGTFIHELLEETFRRFKNKKPQFDKKFSRYFFGRLDEKFEEEIAKRMRSDAYLLKKIIVNRMERFLKYESSRRVARIVSLEEKRRDILSVGGKEYSFNFTVDRIDELDDGDIIILDYKTGGTDVSPRGYAYLKDMAMDRLSIRDALKSFQLPLYYYFVKRGFPDCRVNAQIYNLRTLTRHSFIGEGDFAFRDEIMKICLDAIVAVCNEIFDETVPFAADPDERRCQYCPFAGLC